MDPTLQVGLGQGVGAKPAIDSPLIDLKEYHTTQDEDKRATWIKGPWSGCDISQGNDSKIGKLDEMTFL